MKNTFNTKNKSDDWTALSLENWNLNLTDWSDIDLEDWTLPKLDWIIPEIQNFNVK